MRVAFKDGFAAKKFVGGSAASAHTGAHIQTANAVDSLRAVNTFGGTCEPKYQRPTKGFP
jgi:hypothetical protein